jgi:lipid-binding SYLF domain-containing protein
MRRNAFSWILALAVAGSPILFAGTAAAGGKDTEKAEKGEMKRAEEMDEAERAQMAADVIEELLGAEDGEIPEYLLENAQGIAVIPNVVKGALFVGGKFGKGLVAARQADGDWSAPAYVDLGGASYGLQIGVEATDLVLVFVEKDGLKALLEDNLKLGGEISIAAGPIGRKAAAGTNLTLDSAIYSYSRTKGIFAGVSMEGAILNIDGSANEAVYGAELTAEQILHNEELDTPEAAMPFHAALHKHVPMKDAE